MDITFAEQTPFESPSSAWRGLKDVVFGSVRSSFISPKLYTLNFERNSDCRHYIQVIRAPLRFMQGSPAVPSHGQNTAI